MRSGVGNWCWLKTCSADTATAMMWVSAMTYYLLRRTCPRKKFWKSSMCASVVPVPRSSRSSSCGTSPAELLIVHSFPHTDGTRSSFGVTSKRKRKGLVQAAWSVSVGLITRSGLKAHTKSTPMSATSGSGCEALRPAKKSAKIIIKAGF